MIFGLTFLRFDCTSHHGPLEAVGSGWPRIRDELGRASPGGGFGECGGSSSWTGRKGLHLRQVAVCFADIFGLEEGPQLTAQLPVFWAEHLLVEDTVFGAASEALFASVVSIDFKRSVNPSQ